MSDILNDNGVVGFTRRITLSVAGQTIADDFKFDLPANAEFRRTNEKSKHTGIVQAKGPLQGTATLQLADATVNPFSFWGQTFTETEGNFVIILPIGKAETKNGETKATVTFIERVGSVVMS